MNRPLSPQSTSLFSKKLLLVATVFAMSSPSCFADESEKKVNLPKRGTLATTVYGGNEGTKVDTFGSTPIGADSKSLPIAGSVSRKGIRDWNMRVINDSEDDYSVSLEVLQKDLRERTVKRNSFSFRLGAGKQESRELKGHPNSVNATLNVTNWKNLSEKKRKLEAAKEAAKEKEASAKKGR